METFCAAHRCALRTFNYAVTLDRTRVIPRDRTIAAAESFPRPHVLAAAAAVTAVPEGRKIRYAAWAKLTQPAVQARIKRSLSKNPVSRYTTSITKYPMAFFSNNRKGLVKTITIIEIVILILVVAGIVAVLFTRQKKTASTTNDTINSLLSNGSALTNGSASTVPADDDGDGLSNADETSLGTNPKLADSDGDGVIDSDESRFYKSNPLNKDSDGDGTTDGDAVKKGMNPADHTKSLLPNINEAKSQFTNQ